MQSRHLTHRPGRAVSVAVIGLASLFAACEAKMPTAAEIDRMDASSVERRARAAGMLAKDDSLFWTVDGVETSEAVAKAIPADSIADVSMSGLNPLFGRLQISIITKRGEQLAFAGKLPTILVRRRPLLKDGKALDPISALASTADREQPAIFIDGVRAGPAAMKALDASRIADIEIIKGAAAIEVYGDAAKKGVIAIKTKPAGAP